MIAQNILTGKRCVCLLVLLSICTIKISAQGVGVNTTTPLAKFHVEVGSSISDGVLFTGEPSNETNFPSLGAGNRFMFYPTRAAIRAGIVGGTQWDNIKVGVASTAFGSNTIARSAGTFAINDGTTAGGYASSAFGSYTITKGYASMVIGMFNDSLIVGADQTSPLGTTPLFMIGNGTSNATRHNTLVVYNNGILLSKNPAAFYYTKLPSNYSLPVSGEGTRMMWIPELSAFRVGTAIDSAWNVSKIGAGSFASGVNTTASGAISTATGFNTKASGGLSTAMGHGTVARGYGSMAVGLFSNPILTTDEDEAATPQTPIFMIGNGDDNETRHNAMVVYKNGNLLLKNPTTVTTDPGVVPVPFSGTGTRMMWLPQKSAFRAGTVEGMEWDSVNIGPWSFAAGYNNTAFGRGTAVFGNSNNAIGNFSVVVGSANNVTGASSFASGNGHTVSGSYSMAVGIANTASATSSFAQGDNVIASGVKSFAAGNHTSATGIHSIAMGSFSTASGNNSRAIGNGCVAGGDLSTVMGKENISKGYSSMVFGMYNDSILLTNQTSVQETTPLFIIGNGDGSGTGLRKNAMVVRKDGHVGIGTSAPETFLHIDVGARDLEGFLVEGLPVPSGLPNVPDLGSGIRMSFFTSKSAFRAGRVTGTQWDNVNTGYYSSAMGYNSIASGEFSTAIGFGTVASGSQSLALGTNSRATGLGSVAMGANTNASGNTSAALGGDSHARSSFSFVNGIGNVAKGYASTVIGMYCDSLLTTNQTLPDDLTPLFIVGNGSSTTRKNAMLVWKTGNTDFNGYTRLGKSTESAPEIKMKKLTGVSNAAQNAWTNVAHGLTMSKILSVDIIMTIPGFVNLPPSYTYSAGYEYHYQVSATNIVVINSVANSGNILSKAFTILITYEE